MTSDDRDLAEVVSLERQLLDPGTRASREKVEAILHPEFTEFGGSGRVWDRAAIAESLSADPGVAGTPSDFVPIKLAPDVVLLTYRLGGAPGSLRSSVWVRSTSGAWRLRFHQGTRAAPG